MQAFTLSAESPNTPKLLVQITDLHLMDQPESIMRHVNTDDSLRAVLDLIQTNEDCPDLLLATGDLAQDGSPRAYQRLSHILGQRQWPVRCLPGNHDDPQALKAVMGSWMQPVTDIGAWRIISLDSTIQGSNSGHVTQDQLDLLDSAAAQADDRYLLIALHHNPIHGNNDFTDTMMLNNAQALFQRLSLIPRARILLWGHVHQAIDRRRHHVRLLSTPSTCFQFGVRDGRHVADDSPPGYRWIKLYDDGSLATGIRRLPMDQWKLMKHRYQTTIETPAIT